MTRESRSYESPSSLQTFTSPYEGAVVCSDAALPFIFYYALDDLLLEDTKLTNHHCDGGPPPGWSSESHRSLILPDKIVFTFTSLALREIHIIRIFLY